MTAEGGQRRRLAATVDARRTLRASRRYRAVLALIIVSFLFSAIAPDESWTRGVLLLIESATLATALWRSGADTVRWPLLSTALAAVLAVVQIVAGGQT